MPGSVLTDPADTVASAGTRSLVALAEAAALGTACALAGSVPAAARASGEGVSFVAAWLGAAALLAVPAAVSVAIGRAARRGWIELADGHGGALAAGLAVWVALVTPVYVVLGTVLEATTHHRALGGATFGALAVFVALAAALAAWRTVAFALALVARTPARRTGVVSAALVLFALALATPAGRIIVSTGLGLAALPAPARAAFIDASVALVALAAAVLVDLRRIRLRVVATAGPAALVLVVALGLCAVATSPALQQSLATHTALAGPMARALGFGVEVPLGGTPEPP